jgi:hypothetical protein
VSEEFFKEEHELAFEAMKEDSQKPDREGGPDENHDSKSAE